MLLCRGMSKAYSHIYILFCFNEGVKSIKEKVVIFYDVYLRAYTELF